jgi:hypothetical protein
VGLKLQSPGFKLVAHWGLKLQPIGARPPGADATCEYSTRLETRNFYLKMFKSGRGGAPTWQHVVSNV